MKSWRLPLSKSARNVRSTFSRPICSGTRRARSYEALPGVEEDSLAGPDDRVRRIQTLVLRDAIDLKDQRRTGNVRHAPDGLIWKITPL